MKTNTSHLQAAPTNDLLNLPDIDGVFNEVKTSTSPSSSQPMLRAAQQDIPQTVSSWQLFQQYPNSTATVSRSTAAKTMR